MMVKTKGRRAGAHQAGTESLSDSERGWQRWRQQRVTRRLRLARQQLAKASAKLVEADRESARWFCLTVSGGKEFSVEKLLTDAGVQVLLPSEKVVWVKRGKKVEGERLMFPGYLLVRIVPSAEAFEGLRRQERQGVTGFVSGPTGYHVISDRELNRWWQLSDAEIGAMETDKTIGQGSRVRVKQGFWAGLTCVVIDVKWRRKPTARLQIEGAASAMPLDKMPIAFLEKL